MIGSHFLCCFGLRTKQYGHMIRVIQQNICSAMRLARQKIDWGLWFGGVRMGVSLTMHTWPAASSCDQSWTFKPSAAVHVLTGKQHRKETGKEIHFSPSSFIMSVVMCVSAVCALTEVQGNYLNIWMAEPSLNPLTNDAWLLQKGMGRTLLPLTDISHQRSMTYLTLVS